MLSARCWLAAGRSGAMPGRGHGTDWRLVMVLQYLTEYRLVLQPFGNAADIPHAAVVNQDHRIEMMQQAHPLYRRNDGGCRKRGSKPAEYSFLRK